MSAKNEQLLDNIWVTSKTRMIAEERYRSYSLAAHIFTSYYSLLLIIFSIFSSDISGFTAEFDKIILTLAVLVFSLSLILGGFHFSYIDILTSHTNAHHWYRAGLGRALRQLVCHSSHVRFLIVHIRNQC